MKTNRTISLCMAALLLTTQFSIASPVAAVQVADKNLNFEFVSADCYAVGQDKAAELGGELAKATAETVDGVPVCQVVVLVPGKDGARPKRIAIDIPQ